MAKKVLICNPVAEEAVEMLEDAGLKVDKEFGMSKEELTEKVPPYHGMVVRSSTKVREPTIDAAENL
ncbi:MAG: phosphoglycerate dehydrogenase, partial [Candidatus Thermoplasmatota archaeon]|nr:phosphoglycerate dehydrogenase [Candidatus Thermoplasmatota archaeon]